MKKQKTIFKSLAHAGLFSVLLTAIAAGILHVQEVPWHLASAGLLVAFALVAAGFLFAGMQGTAGSTVHAWTKAATRHPARVATATWVWALVAYGFYALGVQFAWLPDADITLRGSGIFLTMITAPLALGVAARGRTSNARPWWFLGIIALIWAPFDSGLLAPVWPWPEGGAAYMLNVWISCVLAISAMRIAGADMYFSTASFRILPDLRDFAATMRDQLWFTPLAIGFGLLTGFFAWNPKIAPIWHYPVEALGLYLTVALPEELLFRGLMQPTLEKFAWPRALNRQLLAKWLTAIIFGLSHLNNDPVGDWRYVMLATMAGIAYANVYERTGRRSLAAPALLHTGVDWLWSTFLRAF
jgi:hypothetical protein